MKKVIIKNLNHKMFYCPRFRSELLKKYKIVEYKGVKNVNLRPSEEIFYCYKPIKTLCKEIKGNN